MELENHTAVQTYIQLLADTLKRKTEVLNQLLELTERQELIIEAEDLNEEEFLRVISLKEEQLQVLDKLDSGFEKLYESVREELTLGKEKYKEQVNFLKEQISVITDLSVRLQTLERRNKAKLEVIFATKRKNLKNARISSQTVANYYKTISKQHEDQSFFYDKKN
jgi:hypothetical protein